MSETLSYTAELTDAITPVVQQIVEQLNQLASIMIDVAMRISDGFAEVTTALDDVDTSLGELSGYADESAASLQQVTGILIEETNVLDENTVAIDENTTALQENATSSDDAKAAGEAGAGGLMGMGLMAAMAGAALFKMGLDTDQALTRVMALAVGTSQGEAQVRDALDQMAGEVGKTTTDLANGLYDVVSGGFTNMNDALKVLYASAELAAVGGTDLHTVTNGLTSIMKMYGYQASQAATVTGILMQGVKDGKSSFLDYSNAIGLVAETAHSAGFSLNEAAAALSTLTIVFPNARRAGMDLQNLLRQIGINSAKVGEEAKKMGLSFDQAKFDTMNLQEKLQYLEQITGGNQAEMLKLTGGAAGYAAAQVLLNGNMADYQRILKDVNNSQGSLASSFAIYEQSIGGHIDKMKGALSGLIDKLTQLAAPAVNAILDALAGIFSNLGQVIAQNGNIILPILGALATVIGAILVPMLASLVGGLLATVGAAALAAAPFAAVAGAIIGLGLAIKAAYEHSAPFRAAIDGVKQALEKVWGAIQPLLKTGLNLLKQAFEDLKQKLLDAWNAVQPWVTGALDKVRGFFQTIAGALQNLNSWLTPTPGHFQHLGDMMWYVQGKASGFQQFMGKVGDVLGHIGQAAKDFWQALQPAIQALEGFASELATNVAPVAESFWADLQMLWQTVQQTFIPVWKQLVDVWNSNLKPAFNGLMNALKPLLPVFKGLGQLIGVDVVIVLGLLVGAFNGIIKMLGTVISGVAQFVGGFIQLISGVVQTIVGIVMGFVKTFQDIFTGNWKAIGDDLKQAWDNIRQGLSNAMNGIVSMGQGIFKTFVKSIFDLVSGFVSGVIGFFKNLWDKLTGHSIIPDMINDMLGWFKKIPGLLLQALGNLVSTLMAPFTDLAKQAFNWAGNFMNGLINGIKHFAQGVWDAAKGVANGIANFFKGLSPPKEGPLSTMDTWGPNLNRVLAEGITKSSGQTLAAAAKVAGGIQSAITGGLKGGALNLGGGEPMFALGGSAAASSSTPQHIEINLNGGLGAGLQMLNPADRTRFLNQIAQYMGQQVNLQTKISAGYAGF